MDIKKKKYILTKDNLKSLIEQYLEAYSSKLALDENPDSKINIVIKGLTGNPTTKDLQSFVWGQRKILQSLMEEVDEDKLLDELEYEVFNKRINEQLDRNIRDKGK